jgi:hypothetical protein
MTKYLIEVHHEQDNLACEHAVSVFLSSGSHFLTNADWGCLDGEHKAWFIIEVDNKEQALQIVPPAFRKDTRVIRLTRFTTKDFETQSLII